VHLGLLLGPEALELQLRAGTPAGGGPAQPPRPQGGRWHPQLEGTAVLEDRLDGSHGILQGAPAAIRGVELGELQAAAEERAHAAGALALAAEDAVQQLLLARGCLQQQVPHGLRGAQEVALGRDAAHR